MHSASIREARETCFHGCFPAPLLGFPDASKPTSKTINIVASSHHDFAAATAASLFPNTQFTNHESLPPLPEALSCFTTAYSHYSQTQQADQIRAQHYFHLSLSNHVCFDYVGLGLFSYSQQQACNSTPSSSSSSPPPPNSLHFPFFDISYKPTTLHSQILNRNKESGVESRIRKRIMDFLNISDTDYHMVFTANRASAFKLLIESYPFQSNPRLLTVYDYNSEAVRGMIDSSQKRGAQVMSAKFSWPGLKIHPEKLTKLVVSKKKNRNRGLFVFPLQSRMTGRRYSYLWMSLAQENGWHVLLDACALGPKDMKTFGLSLFRPDFLICSFFKVFGENPSGFGCLFVKRSSASVLETSTTARSSIGIVTLVPAKKLSPLPGDDSDDHLQTQEKSKLESEEDDLETERSFSGPILPQSQMGNELRQRSSSSNLRRQLERLEHGEVSEPRKEPFSSEIVELENPITNRMIKKSSEIECECLDHADSLGLTVISSRGRYLTNWLVNALMKLRHPHLQPEQGLPLVRIYGPKIKFNRGPALAFNVFDWKGKKVEPVLVQKLGDRSNISLSCGFLQNIWFSDKYLEEKESVLEISSLEATLEAGNRTERVDLGITVVTAALGFLANFDDTYRLWAFIAQFLDADFVEKERWRYTALNQKTIEV